jgi:hypothetical protein
MSLFVLLLAAVGCSGGHTQLPTDSEENGGEDLECPDIEHIPVTSPQIIGVPVTVTATVTDETGVQSVILYYKVETAILWEQIPLGNDGGSGSIYSNEIPGTDVGGAGGMHYYIWAQDSSPAQNECTRPTDGEDGPFHFTIDAG